MLLEWREAENATFCVLWLLLLVWRLIMKKIRTEEICLAIQLSYIDFFFFAQNMQASEYASFTWLNA
jgi:hypothetical protein